jgi:hypothetical protein
MICPSRKKNRLTHVCSWRRAFRENEAKWVASVGVELKKSAFQEPMRIEQAYGMIISLSQTLVIFSLRAFETYAKRRN